MIKMAEKSEDRRGQAEGDLKRRKIEFYEWRSEFDRHDGTLTGKFKLVLDVIEPTKNVLEVGCGDGGFLKILSTASSQKLACGVDISERALRTAKSSGVEVIRCDIDNGLPFKNECFEVVLCFDVIEHLFDPDYLLTEAFRVLAWGGVHSNYDT